MTPNFEGRQELRDFFRTAVRAHRLSYLELEFGIAERLANRLVPVDLTTATARGKLLHAVRGPRQARDRERSPAAARDDCRCRIARTAA